MDVKELDESSFHQFTLGDVALVDFSAVWCGPCRHQEPILHDLAKEGLPVGKVDVDENPAISGKYGIMGVPTLILFKQGREVQRFVGVTSRERIRAALGA